MSLMACPLLLSMKYSILLFISGLLISCSGKSNRSDSAGLSQEKRPTTTIEWLTETTHDFGAYTEQDTVRYDFVYRNVGSIPFVIDSIKVSCGCTRANYIKRAVLPGKTDTIHVSYDGNGFLRGSFHKSCDIYANTDSVLQLRITGYYDGEEKY